MRVVQFKNNVERTRFFAHKLFGNAGILKRAARDWVDAASWFRDAPRVLSALVHAAWVATPNLAFEASRKGSRHTVTVYPFGWSSPMTRLLRVPLGYMSAPLKQAVQCFLASDACLSERTHPRRGILVVDDFQYNSILAEALKRYRVLVVCSILETMCDRGKIYAVIKERDAADYLAEMKDRFMSDFLQRCPGLRRQTEDAWKVARGGATARLASALNATIKVEKC